ncbi:GatB/YqeY domain-containing protein [candidate division NPL-UPA2 bacterium]|nr:GatB/YqeY domain-containing protein [candidate division NPL-UPA2 bacterium]
MLMSLEERLLSGMRESLKKGDKLKLSAIRLARAAIKNKEIEQRKKLSPDEIIEVLSSLAKKHKEAIEQFRAGGRDELAHKEEAELAVLQEYLPKPLKKEELDKIVEEVIAEVKAESKADLGKAMSLIMPRVRGRADGRIVKEIVLRELG